MGSKLSFYNITDHKLTKIDNISDIYTSSTPNQTLYSLIKQEIPVLYMYDNKDYENIKYLNWEGNLIIITYSHLSELGISKADNIDSVLIYNNILKQFISSTKKDNMYTASYWHKSNPIYSRCISISELARVKPEITLYSDVENQYAFYNPILTDIINGSRYMKDICNLYDGVDNNFYVSPYSNDLVSSLREYFVNYEKTFVKDIIEYTNTIKKFTDMIHTLNNISSDVEFLKYLRSNIDIRDNRLNNTIDLFIDKNKKESDDIEILNKYLETDPELKDRLSSIIKKCREEEQNGVSK